MLVKLTPLSKLMSKKGILHSELEKVLDLPRDAVMLLAILVTQYQKAVYNQ